MKPYSKQSCLIDTLSVVRSLEAKGFPTKQAEAIAFVIARSLNDCSNKVSATLVSKVEMQQYMTLREERLSAFKCELQALQNIVLPVEYVCGRMTHHLHAIFVIQTLSNNCFMQHIRVLSFSLYSLLLLS
ncbi:hypothetical protein QVD17_40468 [Tagetes erecta]|uniref:Uncharacterized protein n=1 Tax=Tagetes erecta TaxID=13708 RepID=A0AAD8JPZ2_TARER|nr:hypothetical protein QVD17_40468 [Tagetes erecta]